MRSDCPSIPTRGSRFVGLLSIIITSVLGSGACEQESTGSIHIPTINNRLVILSGAKDLLVARSHPAALGIRNPSQDRRPLRPRCRGHIAWPPMPRLMRKQSKRHRLLRCRRKAELIGETQLDPQRRDFIAQHRHQRRILYASARDNHRVTTLLSRRAKSWQHEALDGVRNRSRR